MFNILLTALVKNKTLYSIDLSFNKLTYNSFYKFSE